ncbi:MAG: prolyl oligopeptidase family serine peptidase [Rubrivivax sp.]|nr:prolyl oligopeptidase family serine peptidase [Rubrivivax sp.]
MRPTPRHFSLIAALAAIVVFTACTTPPAAVPVAAVLAPPAAMRTEGVPALPAAPLEAAQRYNRVAGHGFADWHPTRREMLVSHRVPGASTTQLFRVRAPMAPPEPLTDGADPVAVARWEPSQGQYIVFARGRGGDEAYQLYRLDPDTRQAVQFTPDGQRHALAGWLKAPRPTAIVSSVPLDRTAEGGSRAQIVTTLSLMDPMQQAPTRVLAELPGGGWTGVEVAPDQKQLAITRYVSAGESEVWLIDITSGQRKRLLPAPGEALRASHFVGAWSHDGRTLYKRSDRASEFRELMRYELASGELTRLSADTPWDVGSGSLSADGQQLAFVANVDGRDELRLIDPTTGAALPLPAALPGGSITHADFHPSRPELALVVNSTQGPAQVHSLDVATGSVTAWTRPAGIEGLDLASLPEQQVVRWKSFDGLTVSGILTLPPARFTGRRPVLMLVHGGPEAQAKLGWMGRSNHLVQQLGIPIFQPNVRGSSGYGKTFLSLDNGRLREDSVKDMGTAIDWMATHPRLDAQRVVVAGGSYGGYMALAASTRLADRIAGAVSSVGISNFISFLQNTESYRRDLRRVEYGDEREPAMRQFLTGISPLAHADKITKPLLVVQGKNDPRVPWTESEQIVRSLQARGTPVWYLLADNEGHGFARRENADYYFAALMQFLQQTVKP